MFQSIGELIRDYWKTIISLSSTRFFSDYQTKTRYEIDFPLKINVFNIIALCLMTSLATAIFSISCIFNIRRRGEMLSLHGIALLTIAASSLALLVAATQSSVIYFRFNDQDAVYNLLVDLFLATNLLAGLILLRVKLNME
jgi:hypothetical protein